MIPIIVVEDDADLCDSVCRYLSLVGMDAHGAGTAEELFQKFAEHRAAVVVLDVNLPDTDGFSVARQLRKIDPLVGIVMLTARSQLDDRVTGLKSGADSYLVKPVQLRELDALIRSLARRVTSSGGGGTEVTPEPVAKSDDPVDGEWGFDRGGWTLFSPQGQCVSLTNAEYCVVGALVTDQGKPVSRAQIAEALGRHLGEHGDRSIDAILTRLRRKVRKETGIPLPVKAARDIGYVFVAPVEDRS